MSRKNIILLSLCMAAVLLAAYPSIPAEPCATDPIFTVAKKMAMMSFQDKNGNYAVCVMSGIHGQGSTMYGVGYDPHKDLIMGAVIDTMSYVIVYYDVKADKYRVRIYDGSREEPIPEEYEVSKKDAVTFMSALTNKINNLMTRT